MLQLYSVLCHGSHIENVEKHLFLKLVQGLLKSEQFIIAPVSLVLFCFLPKASLELQHLCSEPLLTKEDSPQ